MLPSILTAAGGGGRARQRRCTLRRVPWVDAPRRQRRCGVHTRPLLCTACRSQTTYKQHTVAHAGGQQVSQRGPVQVSSRTASAVLAAQCQQTAADEHEGQRNAVQLAFDVWHKPARTFKDQVHRRRPHICAA